jgi:glycosyltransferase involved in cell wall biosynthesis
MLVCAGSERVFQCMIDEFPEAEIFTLSYNPKSTCTQFNHRRINTSWINKIIQSHKVFKLLFPISTYVMQYWNFNKYDLIISSSATTAKYVSRFKGKHICFGYYPTRAIWYYSDYFEQYDLKAKIFNLLLKYLKRRDLRAAKRVNVFIAQSIISASAFREIYNIEAPIIHSPINYTLFQDGLNEVKSENYLIVSRLVEWKKIEYAINAFNHLGFPLKIIGTGDQENYLKSKALSNITFLGQVDDESLVKEYGKAKAVIFTPELEYGLVPLEANAAGTPVIAFGKGAILETMVPYTKNEASDFASAVLFDKQTPDSLVNAIHVFENILFNREKISNHAKDFGEASFKFRLRSLVNGYINN